MLDLVAMSDWSLEEAKEAVRRALPEGWSYSYDVVGWEILNAEAKVVKSGLAATHDPKPILIDIYVYLYFSTIPEVVSGPWSTSKRKELTTRDVGKHASRYIADPPDLDPDEILSAYALKKD
jgi:hypothetical protein